MITGSPTSKCGWRITLPPSDSVFITRSVLRTIAAVHCGSVTGCLRLHYTTQIWECPKVRAGVHSSDIELALSLLLVSFLDALETMPTSRLEKFQHSCGLDCWRCFKMIRGGRTVHDVYQCGTIPD
uniref:Uncharacterized protein n=1 Tax=Hyaloperonospora arabidopsidis (strain Emoy2) TaxID=559515 RepID=M4BQC6_HYAAE